MAIYRKLPIEVEAFLFGVDEEPKWFTEQGDVWEIKDYGNRLNIHTLEGVMEARFGEDYIIKGIQGEIYPCKKEIFEKTYILVE